MKYILAAFLLSLNCVLFAQYSIVTIDKETFGPNEPSIYINPINPAQMVAGSNIKNHYVSADSGKTWQIKSLRSSYGVYGDPVVYADEYGNFYFCHLAATNGKKFPNWIDRIVVQKSDDGGLNFSNGCTAGFNNDKIQDKHWIVKDEHSVLHSNNIYLSWTEFDKYESSDVKDRSRIRFARSVNGAQSFEAALTISDTTGDCLDDDNTLEGATPAIGKNGEVYVAWSGYGNIYFDKSTDGGLTWGTDRIIGKQEGGWALNFDQIYRSNGLPFLVADHSRGKYKNRLYLLWGENLPLTGGEIKLKYSDNGGDSWSDAIAVNTNSVGDQFMPHIAIDQTDGTVYVVFYDRSLSSSNLLMDVCVAYSEDGGQSFVTKRINSYPILPPGNDIFFGDYNGIAAHKGIVRPIWTATDESVNGKLTIQTALLSKALLKTKSQILTDTLLFKYFKNQSANTFVLYKHGSFEYNIAIKVKKYKYSPFGKSFSKSGSIYKPKDYVRLDAMPQDICLKTSKGKFVTLKMRLKGKNFDVKYKMKL